MKLSSSVAKRRLTASSSRALSCAGIDGHAALGAAERHVQPGRISRSSTSPAREPRRCQWRDGSADRPWPDRGQCCAVRGSRSAPRHAPSSRVIGKRTVSSRCGTRRIARRPGSRSIWSAAASNCCSAERSASEPALAALPAWAGVASPWETRSVVGAAIAISLFRSFHGRVGQLITDWRVSTNTTVDRHEQNMKTTCQMEPVRLFMQFSCQFYGRFR